MTAAALRVHSASASSMPSTSSGSRASLPEPSKSSAASVSSCSTALAAAGVSGGRDRLKNAMAGRSPDGGASSSPRAFQKANDFDRHRADERDLARVWCGPVRQRSHGAHDVLVEARLEELDACERALDVREQQLVLLGRRRG